MKRVNLHDLSVGENLRGFGLWDIIAFVSKTQRTRLIHTMRINDIIMNDP